MDTGGGGGNAGADGAGGGEGSRPSFATESDAESEPFEAEEEEGGEEAASRHHLEVGILRRHGQP